MMTPWTRARCLVVWAVGAAVAAGTTLLAATTPLPSRGVGFDQLVVLGAAWALAGCAVWAWVVTTVVVAEAWRGRRPGAPPRVTRWAPEVARRAILLACGLATVTAGVAHADPGPAPTDGVRVERGHDDDRPRARPDRLDGLPFPDRPTGPAHPRRPADAQVVVRAGDSLWSIAEQRLGAGAPASEIAQATWATYAVNRDVVGADPDLLLPGTRLELPDAVPDRPDYPTSPIQPSRPDRR